MHQPEVDPSLDSCAGYAPVAFSPASPRAAALETFFSVFPSSLAVWDFGGRIRQANSVFERLISYSFAEMEGQHIFDFVHPDDMPAVAAAFQELLAAGEMTGFECRTRCKDGSYRWLLLNATANYGEKLIYVAAHDITGRKRAEETARRSTEWLRFTLDAAGVGLCYRESGETKISEQQFRLYGLEPAEEWLARECWLQAVHPKDRERVEIEQRLAIEQGKPYDIQFRVVWPDTSVHWLLCRGKIFDDDGSARKMEVTMDLTERKRAEAALEEFFDLCRSPMAIFGFDGSIKRVNAGLLRTSGYTAEEFAGRPALEFFHPDDRPAVQAEIQKLITWGGDTEFECRSLCRDGSVVWLVFSATAVPDEKSIFTVAYDITERRRMEQEILVHSEKLGRSNAELERFAYVASHDLQEPLRMVASFTQLLAKRYSGQLDETADRYIHYAADGAKRMQQLISDLLAYSRVNSKELDLRQTDFGAVVLEAMRNLQVAIEESGASIDWDPLPELWVDPAQFTQLLQNLLGNAIKFRRSEEHPRIHISAADTGTEWALSVQDNGIGIDPQHADRIFQIFQRLHTREKYQGTGIGLAICKKVVERHGGRIWVESQPGKGSNFHFALPKVAMGVAENGTENGRTA